MVEYETPAKSANEIFDRMTCLGMFVILGHQVASLPRSSGEKQRQREKLYGTLAALLRSEWRDTLTASERLLVEKPITGWTQADELNVGWSMECLAWSIQLLGAVPPFDCAFAEWDVLETFVTREEREELRRKIKLRTPAELDAFQTEAERWHWTANQARGFFQSATGPSQHQRQSLRLALGESGSLYGKPYDELAPDEFWNARSIAHERHRAINWIWDGEPWDDVTTDT